jgi:hypothetical protein
MADFTLGDLDQATFDAAEAIVIELTRAEYPNLDLRRGTVLRDLLVRPAAAWHAVDEKRMEDLKSKNSLTALQANEATADPDDVNAILSNFNMTRNPGAKSSGELRVRIDDANTYSLTAGFRFSTLDGKLYELTENYAVRPNADADQIPVQLSADGTTYFFIIPATAVEPGTAYDMEQGTALDPVGSLYGFIAADVYTDFVGGIDDETISQAIERLPVSISNRSLTSRTSIEAQLRDQFADASFQIQAMSVQGMGDPAQLRDKHNPMGFTVGSRTDVYSRNFVMPKIITLQKTGTLVGPNSYQFDIDAIDAPGYYAIRSISEVEAVVAPELDFGQLPVAGSYPFTDTRRASGINDTFHDIDPDNSMIETAYSVFQASTVVVQDVPHTDATRNFKVEVYVTPGLLDMQNYVDLTEVRNTEADILLRCPLICLVGLETTLYFSDRNPVDIDAMKSDLVNYINTRSFTRNLTRSELACLLLGAGATRVDLSDVGTTLQGTIRDAAGVMHRLSGDALDIEAVEDGTVLLTTDTCVFAAEEHNIHITAIQE